MRGTKQRKRSSHHLTCAWCSLGETISHSLLAQNDLAPPLLARFQNGLLYRFIRGRVCKPEDLRLEPIWRGVAKKLGEWHGILPVVSSGETDGVDPCIAKAEIPVCKSKDSARSRKINSSTPTKSVPTLWTVLQKWILALPTNSEPEGNRRDMLQDELKRIVIEFGTLPDLGEDGVWTTSCMHARAITNFLRDSLFLVIAISFLGT